MDVKTFINIILSGGFTLAVVRYLLGRMRLHNEEANDKIDNAIKLGQNAFDISQKLQESLREDIERLTKQNQDMSKLLDLLIKQNKKLQEENMKLKKEI